MCVLLENSLEIQNLGPVWNEVFRKEFQRIGEPVFCWRHMLFGTKEWSSPFLWKSFLCSTKRGNFYFHSGPKFWWKPEVCWHVQERTQSRVCDAESQKSQWAGCHLPVICPGGVRSHMLPMPAGLPWCLSPRHYREHLAEHPAVVACSTRASCLPSCVVVLYYFFHIPFLHFFLSPVFDSSLRSKHTLRVYRILKCMLKFWHGIP